MQVFETTPKSWGNSLGVTIPRNVARKEHLSTKRKMKIIVIGEQEELLKKAFGTLTLKKTAQQLMDEIDQGYD